jgi:toxin ParE1/3/4
MRVRWLRASAQDLAHIRAYIAQHNRSAAENMRLLIIEAIRQLRELPRLGRPGRREGTRELIVAPYIVVYRIAGDVVEILAVYHGAQDR